MSKVYSITFKDNGKSYYFKTEKENIPINVTVIVETERGLQFGKVINEVNQVDIGIEENKLKEIIRIATKEDYSNHLKNLKDADKALQQAKDYVNELKLDMIVLEAVYTFDRKQLLFNFTADERVDFRELAKKLATKYRTRIELRQIGARDKAKEIGGIGQCGRCLCCNTFLNRIDSISMNMAKNQNIALNPSKINGQCGRLLCCLTYENDEYLRCSKEMPSVGQNIKTPSGYGKVVSVNILNRSYQVDIDGQKIDIELGICEKNCK